MPADWLVYWITRPFGLLLVALALAFPFVLWRVVLGTRFAKVGFIPLFLGYGLAAVGLLLANLTSSYLEFNSRVSANALSEAQRWTTIPGWTFYLTVLSLVFVLPMLGLFAAPVCAWLLRRNCFTYGSMSIALIGTWLALALLAWSFPSNEWHRTHRFESLLSFLSSFGLSIASVGLPFLLGIYLATRWRPSAEA